MDGNEKTTIPSSINLLGACIYFFSCYCISMDCSVIDAFVWTSGSDRTLCSHCKGREAELYCKTVANGMQYVLLISYVNSIGLLEELICLFHKLDFK